MQSEAEASLQQQSILKYLRRSQQMNPDHPFLHKPHRTVLRLTVPTLLSLAAEPLTGLADTAFVAKLGNVELAGLGAAAIFLSSLFWLFGFLGVGTQTEVARFSGSGDASGARESTRVALTLAAIVGSVLTLVLLLGADTFMRFMEARGETLEHATEYALIRAWGAPAVLLTIVASLSLRGQLDMRTPLISALVANALNLALDPLLIWGAGPIAGMGVRGAALASVLSQWVGAAIVLFVLAKQGALRLSLDGATVRRLAHVGADMIVRTGCLILFLILATRSATRMGPDAGAAHQAIRQVWSFTALLMDAFAMTAQSLVAFFVGASRILEARRVARICTAWTLAASGFIAVGMLALTDQAASLLVPAESHRWFHDAWFVSACSQPLSGLSFVTDGIHWGTGDYRYLKYGVVLATSVGVACIVAIDADWRLGDIEPLALLWMASGVWTLVRAAWGSIRVWPGIGVAPLRL